MASAVGAGAAVSSDSGGHLIGVFLWAGSARDSPAVGLGGPTGWMVRASAAGVDSHPSAELAVDRGPFGGPGRVRSGGISGLQVQRRSPAFTLSIEPQRCDSRFGRTANLIAPGEERRRGCACRGD